MALSALDDERKKPDAKQLSAVLGQAVDSWKAIVAHVESEYAPAVEQWNFSGQKFGWSMRLIQKKRTILYMTPSNGFFYVGFVLGERAANAAMKARLPKKVITVIETAPKYAEGRGFRLEVPKKASVAAIKKLAAMKMNT